jgi:hypothetical protein
MRSKFKPTYQIFGTMTNPAAVTKSIGLPADAPLSWFLQSHLDYFIVSQNLTSIYRDLVPSGQFYHDRTTRGHLSGLSHLDNFIMTQVSCPLTGTVQKLMPTLTQTATPHTTGPLVVI